VRVMAVTIQKEVADRLLAGPGSKVYGSIGVVAQASPVTRIANLPNECFWPRPRSPARWS
jgi:16S rRNA (adenine1518-N6/adenine1519-N6)-dimethyltransferase